MLKVRFPNVKEKGKLLLFEARAREILSRAEREAVFDDRLPPLLVDVGSETGQNFVIDVGNRTLTRK
jgi:hypothetical protein